MTPAPRVDVLPAQREQLTTAQAGVDRGRPNGTVVVGESDEQLGRLGGRGDPVAARAHGGHREPGGRVDFAVAAVDGAAVHRAQRQQRSDHGRRREPFGHEAVDEA
jgi:hypothetical protein